MQQEKYDKDRFKKACFYPVDMLTAMVEMEHRRTGADKDDLLRAVAEVMTDREQVYKVASDGHMALRALKIEHDMIATHMAEGERYGM